VRHRPRAWELLCFVDGRRRSFIRRLRRRSPQLVEYHGSRGHHGILPAQFATPEEFRALTALVDALSQRCQTTLSQASRSTALKMPRRMFETGLCLSLRWTMPKATCLSGLPRAYFRAV
jgi:hypothetical protein